MKITRYMGAFAVIAMLAACSTDDELGANTAANEVKIAATIGGNSIFTRSNPLGTEAKQQSFNEGDVIDVFTEGKQVIYTKNKDGQWVNANDYLLWTGNAQTFHACYPGNGNNNSIYNGYISSDQSTVEKIAQSDYMTCIKIIEKADIPSDRQLDLNFERQTARIIVKVNRFGDEFDGLNPTLSAVEVYSKYRVPARESDSYTHIITYKKEESGSNVFYALVSPGAGNATDKFLKLTVTYNDSEGNPTQTKELYVTGIPALEKAKSYTYDVKIGKEKATIGSVSVEDWGEGVDITGGDASITPPEKIIEQALAAGETNITLNLAADFSDFSKITDALKNAKEGTINLTLKGCDEIKDFNFVKSLKSIKLPDVITIIGAFQECTNLESVYAPNLKIIERYSFNNCLNLRKVEFGTIQYVAVEFFDGIQTGKISLTLSADQTMMTKKYDLWELTSTKYKDSQDHKDRNFCNFIFESIKCGDSTY